MRFTDLFITRPVLAIVVSLGVLLAGGLFGVTGVVFATPLLVAMMVLVRTLYVEDALEGGHASG